jgi:hypothetical protein
MEKETSEVKVLNFLEKFSGSSAENIAAVTGIFKLNVHKVLKKLAEDGKVTINKGANPPTFSKAEAKSGKKVVEAKESVPKEPDEVHLPSTGRDTSKYIVGKTPYPKSRAVLETVKQYVKDHPRISLQTLQTTFKSSELQKRYGTIVEINQAKKIIASSGRPRHFINDVLTVGGKKVVVSNQWNTELFERFQKISAGLKYSIKKQ